MVWGRSGTWSTSPCLWKELRVRHIYPTAVCMLQHECMGAADLILRLSLTASDLQITAENASNGLQ